LWFAGGEEPFVVGGGRGVVADSGERDDVERPVELAVTAAVEPVASLLATGGVDRTRAGERGEGCLARHPARVAARDEQLGAADRSDAALLEQIRRRLGEERSQCALGLGHFV
jgi:hypothetical protein